MVPAHVSIHTCMQSLFVDSSLAISSVQSLSRVRLFATPWTAARQVSLPTTNPHSLLKLMSIESVMASNHLILCHSLLLLPSIFPSIRVFSKELVLCIRWPKYWSFGFSISPSESKCFSGVPVLAPWLSHSWQFDLCFLCLFKTA